MSFKKILGILLMVVLITGALVLFFSCNTTVDTATQTAEIIKDQVEGLNVTDKIETIKTGLCRKLGTFD